MKHTVRSLLSATLLIVAIGACANDPVLPQNRQPSISSLTAFPQALAPGDSTLVICEASDPDGDRLVYDWFTDSRLIIKGNSPDDHELYNSPSKTQVFYHGAVTPFDTAWVRCTVRDGVGGSKARVVTILVNQ